MIDLGWEHLTAELEQGSLSLMDFGLLATLAILADPETKSVVTNARRLGFATNSGHCMAQKYLVRLERKGFIRRSSRERSRTPYEIHFEGRCWLPVPPLVK